MNQFRINLSVDTDIPIEFLFMFFIPSIKNPELVLKDVTVTMVKFHNAARVLEDGQKWRDTFRFVSFFQVLREMSPLEESVATPLSDKEFSQEMKLRFENAKRKTLERIITLFKVEAGKEEILMVYDDFRVIWKEGENEKEQSLWISVPVGFAIAPKSTRPF